MKTISLIKLCILFIFIGHTTFAADSVTVQVFVSDFDQKAKPGRTIFFECVEGNCMYQATANKDGKFEIKLVAAQDYFIKVKGIGEVAEYMRLNIPALKPNEYGVVYEVNVMLEDPKTFVLNGLEYESASDKIKPGSEEILKDLVEYLKLEPSVKIEIAGHTDSDGKDDYNLDLSQRRAETLKKYLIKKGIAAGRIKATGYGESKPIADNATEEGKQKNRRTEIIVL